MFPRTYFSGRYFAPRFFPESEGTAPTVNPARQRFCLNAFDGRAFAMTAFDGKATDLTAINDECGDTCE